MLRKDAEAEAIQKLPFLHHCVKYWLKNAQILESDFGKPQNLKASRNLTHYIQNQKNNNKLLDRIFYFTRMDVIIWCIV